MRRPYRTTCESRIPDCCFESLGVRTGTLVDVGVRTGSLVAVTVLTGHLVYVGNPYRTSLFVGVKTAYLGLVGGRTGSLVEVWFRTGSFGTLSVRTVFAGVLIGHLATVGVRMASSRLDRLPHSQTGVLTGHFMYAPVPLWI